MSKRRPKQKHTTQETVTNLTRPKVLVKFLQDRSGSMVTNWDECCSGFNAFIEGLKSKSDEIDYRFSLTLFDDQIEHPFVAVPIDSVPGWILAEKQNGHFVYGPRGWTALYDALGSAMSDEDTFAADKVICVVVTDGAENSSQTFNKDRVHNLVDAKLNAGNWTFQYLGAQPETWQDAAKAGFAACSTVQFDQNNYVATYACLAGATNSMAASRVRSSASMLRDFGDEQAIKSANLKFDPQP